MIDFDTTNFKAILLVRSSHIDLSLSDYLSRFTDCSEL